MKELSYIKKLMLECRDYCEKQSKEYQNFLKSILEKSEEIKNSDEYKEYLEFKKSKANKTSKSTKTRKSKIKNQEGSENE